MVVSWKSKDPFLPLSQVAKGAGLAGRPEQDFWS